MKLEAKCIKAVLEAIESATSCYDSFSCSALGDVPEKLKGYSHDQIAYHIRYCDTVGYLQGCSILGNGAMIIVEDLTPAGHEYLKEVRSRHLVPTIKEILEEKRKDGIRALICAFCRAIKEWVIFFR